MIGSLSKFLWRWTASLRRRPVAAHAEDLRRSRERGDTQAQHAAFVAAKRARTEALRREGFGGRVKKVTLLNILAR